MTNNTTNTPKQWRLKPFEFGVAIVVFLGLGFFLFGGHLFNRNYIEIAHRFACQENLRKIKNAINSRGLSLETNSSEEIAEVISSLNLICPSGASTHDGDHRGSYFVDVTQNGERVITEDVLNHDTERMWFVDLPLARFILWSDGRITEEEIE